MFIGILSNGSIFPPQFIERFLTLLHAGSLQTRHDERSEEKRKTGAASWSQRPQQRPHRPITTPSLILPGHSSVTLSGIVTYARVLRQRQTQQRRTEVEDVNFSINILSFGKPQTVCNNPPTHNSKSRHHIFFSHIDPSVIAIDIIAC